jgi:AhpD family alkylhydroperoxidase
MNHQFDKRIFTASVFIKDVGFLLSKTPRIIGALRNKEITRVFTEKVMTVTTAVNGCRYCSWFHAKQAVASGISKKEVKNMLSLQFHADASDFELPGLLYAQHYAETNRKPDHEMTERLFDFYGERAAKHIMLFIRMIFFGNLFGNTWDAVMSRFKGNPAEESNVVFEIIFFLLTAPIMLPAMRLLKNRDSMTKSVL